MVSVTMRPSRLSSSGVSADAEDEADVAAAVEVVIVNLPD
jgi:hypothetical protein